MYYFFIDCKTNAVEIVKHIRKRYQSLNKFKKNES